MAGTSKDTLEQRFEFAPDKKNSAIGVDIWSMALRYKWFLAAAAAVGLVVGYLGYMKAGPAYEAASRILVSRTATVEIKSIETRAREDRAEHIALIMSPLIVDRAIEKHKLHELPSLAEEDRDDLAQEIITSMKVERSAGKDQSFLNVLDIKYVSTNRADARLVVDAVIDAYGEYLANTEKEYSVAVLDEFDKSYKDVEKQLGEKHKAYLEFRQKAPLIWKVPPGAERLATDVTNKHRSTVEAVEQELHRKEWVKVEVDSRLAALQTAVNNNEPPELMEMMVRQYLVNTGETSALTLDDPRNRPSAEMDALLLPLILQEKKLSRDFNSNHPDVQELRRQIWTIVEFYQVRGVKLPIPGNLPQRPAGPKRVPLVDVYMRALKHQQAGLDLEIARLNRRFDEESQKAKDLEVWMAQDMAYDKEIQGLQELKQTLFDRLNEQTLVKDYNGYRMKQIAPTRSELVIKRPIKFIGAGMVGVIALALGLCYLREFRDTSIKSLEDLRYQVDHPILGGIPSFLAQPVSPHAPPECQQLQPGLCYIHQPASPAAEAFRAVRTALIASAATINAKVLQITSPEPGDGKSTFASNLAIAIAQSGKRVLLIDADLRRPMVQSLFGTRHNIGTVDVLQGEIEFANAVQQSPIANLDLLVTATTPANPAELLSTSRFQLMLSEARTEYEYVIVDTPPLLAVSDPCIVAPLTDATLLVVRLLKNKRAAMERTHELIDTHGIRMLGVVANGLPGEHEGYGYGYAPTANYSAPAPPAPQAITVPPQPPQQSTRPGYYS